MIVNLQVDPKAPEAKFIRMLAGLADDDGKLPIMMVCNDQKYELPGEGEEQTIQLDPDLLTREDLRLVWLGYLNVMLEIRLRPDLPFERIKELLTKTQAPSA